MHHKLLKKLFNTEVSALHAVSGGTTDAKNYQFLADNKNWLLRIFNTTQTLTERQQEGLISQVVGKQGISGNVIYCNDDYLVREYLPGQILDYANMHDKKILASIIQLLKQQHSIPIKNLPKAPTCQQRIMYHVNNSKLTTLWQHLNITVEPMLTALEPVLIHNDLHHANMLLNNTSIQFIDWSLSGVGDRFADLAEIAIYLPEALQQYILQCYFGHDDHMLLLKNSIQERLLLFAAWALNMSNRHINIKELVKPRRTFTNWITNSLKQQLTLTTPEDFIDFAASCIAQFKLHL